MVRFEVPMDHFVGMSVVRQRAVDMLRRQEAYGQHSARCDDGRQALTTVTEHQSHYQRRQSRQSKLFTIRSRLRFDEVHTR
jgi:hypothetical protein